MKKHAKKVLCLTSTDTFTSIVILSATEERSAQPRFAYIWDVSIGLGIAKNGYSTCNTG